MAMNQPALKSAMKAAFAANMPSPTAAQLSAFDTTADAIATAIIGCVQGMTITYISGLANGGGAVTGAFVCTVT